MFVRAYLRASTKDQDAERAKDSLYAFARDHGHDIAAPYIENESGARLDRPELFRLLSDALPGDVLLVEQVDRLSRLTDSDWQKLKGIIAEKQVRIVAQDLPTSWRALKPAGDSDEFTDSILKAVNGLLLDMLAAVARKDYTDRRRRQAQGIATAKAQGKFKGRQEDKAKLDRIAKMLKAKLPWSDIVENANCSRATIAKVAERLKPQSESSLP